MDHYINGKWVQGKGQTFSSINPATQETIFDVHSATNNEVDQAVKAAIDAYPIWANISLEKRIKTLENFQLHLKSAESILTEAISKETGKPLWDSRGEVAAMINKIPLSIESYKKRCATIENPPSNARSITRHKPHGVVVVMGPFNFPGHLPNGHIVPALLAGNTVVFKPSELTPLTAALTIECWEKADLPKGVLNLVQGGPETGKALLSNPSITGVFFTGSAQTGSLILKQLGTHSEKILALEMGGNNPLVVSQISDIKAACVLTILSAYLSSGQRCTCARRLIVINNEQSEIFLKELTKMIENIQVGHYTNSPEPFMGPLIHQKAAENIIATQNKLKSLGGKVKIEAKLNGHTFVSPGLIDVTEIHEKPDEEIFGPLLQLIKVNNLNEAIQEANKTKFGLSAGLFSNQPEEYALFFQKINAGLINWNATLTGASSAAPFGGIGLSGNYRPSAFYAADYCSYPVASMEIEQLMLPHTKIPGLKTGF